MNVRHAILCKLFGKDLSHRVSLQRPGENEQGPRGYLEEAYSMQRELHIQRS